MAMSSGTWWLAGISSRCGRSLCLVSTTVVEQQFVDCQEGAFYVKMVEMFKKVRSGTRSRLPSSVAHC